MRLQPRALRHALALADQIAIAMARAQHAGTSVNLSTVIADCESLPLLRVEKELLWMRLFGLDW